MEVDNLFVDVLNHGGKEEFQILAQYVDDFSYDLIVRRIDQESGWNFSLEIMVCDFIHESIIHQLPPSNQQEIISRKTSTFKIQPSTILISKLSPYSLVSLGDPKGISRKEFNEIFKTDIVVLPDLIFAVGIDNNMFYMYNEAYNFYYEVLLQIKFIMQVALLKGEKTFYFIFAGYDAYLSETYPSKRYKPKIIGETEVKDQNGKVEDLEEDEYPIFYSKKYILAQNPQFEVDYTIPVVDRYYFLCNFYNKFRSCHQGIPFSTKIPLMVNGCDYRRGQKENFIHRRDLGDLTPRQYFLTDAVDKSNLKFSPTEHINYKEMISYKYILDLDGNANTWDGTAWKLNSGSVILKQTSPFHQWFYNDYLPWVHYVPIANDFSDLQEKYQWCESHQEECEKMVKACLTLFQKAYRFHNAIQYTEEIIKQIT